MKNFERIVFYKHVKFVIRHKFEFNSKNAQMQII